jgi:hypothetical protein
MQGKKMARRVTVVHLYSHRLFPVLGEKKCGIVMTGNKKSQSGKEDCGKACGFSRSQQKKTSR